MEEARGVSTLSFQLLFSPCYYAIWGRGMEEASGRLFGEPKLPGHLERRAEGEVSATLGMDTLDGVEESAQDQFRRPPKTQKKTEGGIP